MQPKIGMSYQYRENQTSFSKSRNMECHSICLYLASIWRYILVMLSDEETVFYPARLHDLWTTDGLLRTIPQDAQHTRTKKPQGNASLAPATINTFNLRFTTLHIRLSETVDTWRAGHPLRPTQSRKSTQEEQKMMGCLSSWSTVLAAKLMPEGIHTFQLWPIWQEVKP